MAISTVKGHAFEPIGEYFTPNGRGIGKALVSKKTHPSNEPLIEPWTKEKSPLVDAVEDVQVEILSCCGLRALASISATGKALHKLVVHNRIWTRKSKRFACPIVFGLNAPPIYKQVLSFIEDLRQKARNTKEPQDITDILLLKGPTEDQINHLQDWLPANARKSTWQGAVRSAKEDLGVDLVGPKLDTLATSSEEIAIQGEIDQAYIHNQIPLAQLRKLNLTDLGLTLLPAQIYSLNLTELNLGTSQLGCLPPEICNMTTLMILYLYNNQISSVPTSLNALQNLRLLDLQNNQFGVVPSEVFELSNLEHLYLDYNHLTTLQPDIGKLRRLQYLGLGNNKLVSLPSREISLLRGTLCYLSIENNQLTSIPQEIFLMQLPHLKIDGNPLPLAFRVNAMTNRNCTPDCCAIAYMIAAAPVIFVALGVLFGPLHNYL